MRQHYINVKSIDQEKYEIEASIELAELNLGMLGGGAKLCHKTETVNSLLIFFIKEIFPEFTVI